MSARRLPATTTRRTLTAAVSSMGVGAMTPRRRLSTKALEDTYYQEAYEALQRHNASETYPGPIRAATPGNALNWFTGEGHDAHVLTNKPEDRSYWRPVTDDPEVRELVQVRIRHKENVFVSTTWETRMHVAVVSVPADATVDEIIAEAQSSNSSPYVGVEPYTLAYRGKSVDGDAKIESLVANGLQLMERGITFDAIDAKLDHIWHTDEARPLDWMQHDVSERDEQNSHLVADFKGVATHRNLADESNSASAGEATQWNVVGKPDVDMGHMR